MNARRITTWLVLACALHAIEARAQHWSLTLSAPEQAGAPGATVTWSGTITNTTGAPLPFDVGLDFGTAPQSEAFTINFAPEFAGLGLVVPPGGFTGPIFRITWGTAISGGTHGVGELQLVATGVDTPAVLTAPFSLTTPGAGPFCTSGTGALGIRSAITANDSTGRPTIFHNTSTGALAAVSYDGFAWTTTPIAAGVGTSAEPSAVMDLDLQPHVSFRDAGTGRLAHAWNPGTGWQVETIEAGNVGTGSALHVDGAGQLHVSYFDAATGDLKYATRAGGSWTVQVVDTTGIVGTRSSVATDPSGNPFVAYFDATRGDLRLARRVVGVWQSEIVDSAGTVGDWPSLRWRLGSLAMSYRNATTGANALRYAVGTPGSFATEVVDATGDPGITTTLDHSSFGQPRIAYTDAATSRVKYATKTAGTWTSEVVANGAQAAVTMDRVETDEPFFAWTNASTGELRFGALTACGTLDAPGDPKPRAGLTLFANRPNPFVGATVISFALSRAGEARVRVYDAAGRVVAEPLRRAVEAGTHEVVWNGTGRSGRRLPPGAYIAEVRAGEQIRTHRIVLLR